MSFIDYNFFPILFFLGWNILTCKQLRPNTYSTSNYKILSALSVFSLTDPTNQNQIQSNSKYQKTNDILKFIPEFQFLSENQKSSDINIPQTKIINDQFVFKNMFFKHRMLTSSEKQVTAIQAKTKPIKWFQNKKNMGSFTNDNRVNASEKTRFKADFFRFTYRSKRKRFFSSFFPHNDKIQPLFSKIQSSSNVLWLFPGSACRFTPGEGMGWDPKNENTNWLKFNAHNEFENIFFGGLCSSQNNASFWKKIQKLYHYNWFLNKIARSQTRSFLNRFYIENQRKKAPILKNSTGDRLIVNESVPFQKKVSDSKKGETQKENGYNDFTRVLPNSSFLSTAPYVSIKANTKKFNGINSIQKRRSNIRLLLRSQSQKLYSLNRFQIALCFSKILQPPIFFNHNYPLNLASSFLNGFENDNAFPFLNPKSENASKTQFQYGYARSDGDNRFAKSDQETRDLNSYKKKKKNWYMKIQFFQHIAWSMKHQISDYFLPGFARADIKYLFPTINLPINNFDDYITKPFQLESDQNFSTNGNSSIKIGKDDLKTKPITNKTNNENFLLNSESTKSVWLNDLSKRELETSHLLKTPKFSQNSLLSRASHAPIYGGSWYYENLLAQLGLVNDKTRTLGFLESEPVLNSWYPNFLKQKDVTNKEKRLKSKQFAKNHQTPLENKSEFNVMTRLDSRLNNPSHLKNYGFSPKLYTRFESDIGIYSLAHKLSSVGFRNGNSEIEIYPFKYNDSYRYNFQNMNISNQRLKHFLGLSDLDASSSLGLEKNARPKLDGKNGAAPHAPDISKWTGDKLATSTNIKQNNRSAKPNGSSNFRKFLDFQNPIFSKIYAPVFQPKNLNLLSFITNSFLKVVPNSTINLSSNQIQPLGEYPYFLANYKKIDRSYKATPTINKNFQETSRQKEFKMLNNFHKKLPINGIHANSYPWITQNASERWSASNPLWNFLFNSPFLKSFSRGSSRAGIKPDSSLASTFYNSENVDTSEFLNVPPQYYLDRRDRNRNVSQSFTSVHEEFPRFSKKELLKNSTTVDSFRYFTEKPSCIKKPSIFFSSFRHLPYFFISETLSKKGVTFPEANLNHSLSINLPSSQLDKPMNHNKIGLSTSYSLFQNDRLKENEKKGMKLWKGSLQHKSYNLKPLSTFTKKEVGYQTSLFSWVSKQYSRTNKNIKKNLFPGKKNSISNYRLFPLKKHTWTIFPPLFQPLTFRFIDLNLPRTWSSELFTSIFKSTRLNANDFDSSNVCKNSRVEEKLLGSYPINSHVLSSLEQRNYEIKPKLNKSFQTTKWNGTQKNFFHSSLPFYFSDFFRFPTSFMNMNQISPGRNTRSDATLPLSFHSMRSDGVEPNDFDIQMINKENQSHTRPNLWNNNYENYQNRFFEFKFPLTDIIKVDEYKQPWNNNQKFAEQPFDKKKRSVLNETSKSKNSKVIVYGEKPLLKNRTVHGPPLKNQKESISLPSYLKNITNQNYQNLCPNNLNELYFVFWILFNKTLFIYLSLHYLRKFISFLGTEYIRNLFKIFVTMKFIDGNILSIIKTFQDFNFQLNQQNVIDIKVNKQLKNIKRN